MIHVPAPAPGAMEVTCGRLGLSRVRHIRQGCMQLPRVPFRCQMQRRRSVPVASSHVRGALGEDARYFYVFPLLCRV